MDDLQHLRPAEEVPADDLTRIRQPVKDVDAMALKGLATQSRIASAAHEVGAAMATARAQAGKYYPQVSAGLSSGISTDGDDAPTFELVGSQRLFDFGQLDRSVAQTVLSAEQSHLAFLTEVDDLLVEIATAYVETEEYRQQVDITGAQLARMQEIEALISRRNDEGVASSPDVLDARKQVQSAEALHLNAQIQFARAQRTLATLAGPSALSVKGPLPRMGSACRAAGGKAEATADVRLATLTLAAAELTLESAQKSALPSVALEASAKQDLTEIGDSEPVLGLTLDISTNFFQGGTRKAQVAAAESARQAAQAALAAIRQEVTLDYSGAVDEARNLQILDGALSRQVNYLDEMRELYRRQFLDLGSRSLRELLDIEEEFFQIRLDMIGNRADIEVARLGCLRAAGEVRSHFGLEGKTLYGLALTQ